MTPKILKRINQYITVDPSVLSGRPVIKGSRVPVYLVIKYIANGWSVKDITRKFPTVKEDYISQIISAYSDVFIKNAKNQEGFYSLG